MANMVMIGDIPPRPERNNYEDDEEANVSSSAGGVEETGSEGVGNASPSTTTLVVTTSRNYHKTKEKKKKFSCKKGARLKVQRKKLFDILIEEEQKVELEKYGNSHNYYGTILSGTESTGYKIRFDGLPTNHHVVFVKRRPIIEVIDVNEEEKEYDHQ